MAKAQKLEVGAPYIYGTGKDATTFTIIDIGPVFVTIRNSKGYTITLKKVNDGKETYLQPLTSPTEYPEGKSISWPDKETIAVRASDLLDRREASYPLQKISSDNLKYEDDDW